MNDNDATLRKTDVVEPTDPGKAQAKEPQKDTPRKRKAYPIFEPEVDFGPSTERYKGKVTLSPGVSFRVTANRQKRGPYAVRGTVAMEDPETGHLMQVSGDHRLAIQKHRDEKGYQPLAGKHPFASAVTRELLLRCQESEDYTQAIKAKVIELANSLCAQHREILHEQMQRSMELRDMPLSLAIDLFAAPYLDDRTKSQSMRRTYELQLEKVAKVTDPQPIGKWSLRLLKKLEKDHPDINYNNIKEVKRFLDNTARFRAEGNPAADSLNSYLQGAKKSRDTKKRQKDATNASVLPERVEAEINRRAWEMMGDPQYAGLIMIKEGCLTANAVADLTLDQLQLDPTTPTKVFVVLHRNNTTTATHDYTFPLFPLGAVYINQYIQYLSATFGPERIQGDCYLISDSEDGKTRFAPEKLTTLCREEIQRNTFGYAELAGLEDLEGSKGISLMTKTYEWRLKRFSQLGNDLGAQMFLTHRSLGRSVQSDHYRAFTDQTGRNFLYKSLMRDTRMIPAEKPPYRRRSKRKTVTQITEVIPARTDGLSQTIQFKCKDYQAGDIIEIDVPEGGFVTIIPT